MAMTDTIYALATPYGRSGVAVIRVSGPAAISGLCTLTDKPEEFFVSHKAKLCRLMTPVSRETLDHALSLVFRTPASYTGEDVVEYHTHGGKAVIDELLTVLSTLDGHRMAEPGEFTKRAFENGKMDLTAAEAIADLIDAETSLQKQQALNQMSGALSALYDSWAQRLKYVLAYAEADLDFSDEDLPEDVTSQLTDTIQTVTKEIEAHLDDQRRGERLRDGIRVAVIGAPNAGKSSLVNELAGRDVAIVSEHAGTTRDIIEVHLDLAGYPVILADTAGLRPEDLGSSAQDSIESEGIRRAITCAETADLKLLLFDATRLPDIDKHTLGLIDDKALLVFNKGENRTDIPKEIKNNKTIALSVSTGENMTLFLEELTARVKALVGQNSETPSLTRQRHRKALMSCRDSLKRTSQAPLPELMAEDIRLAIRALGQITGRVDVEDILDVIFRDFCIGK